MRRMARAFFRATVDAAGELGAQKLREGAAKAARTFMEQNPEAVKMFKEAARALENHPAIRQEQFKSTYENLRSEESQAVFNGAIKAVREFTGNPTFGHAAAMVESLVQSTATLSGSVVTGKAGAVLLHPLKQELSKYVDEKKDEIADMAANIFMERLGIVDPVAFNHLDKDPPAPTRLRVDQPYQGGQLLQDTQEKPQIEIRGELVEARRRATEQSRFALSAKRYTDVSRGMDALSAMMDVSQGKKNDTQANPVAQESSAKAGAASVTDVTQANATVLATRGLLDKGLLRVDVPDLTLNHLSTASLSKRVQ